jgi:hypothetical protein
MQWLAAVISLFFVFLPRVVAAQGSVDAPAVRAAADDPPHHLSLQFAVGSQINGGGSVQSASMGYSLTPRLTVLASVERNHTPTRVQHFDNGFGATRGGTLEFVSGELRAALLPGRRVSPYVLTGIGRGVSRPNVNEIFRDRVRNDAGVLFCGGGIRVPLHPHFSLFGDARFVITGERDVASLALPVRAGVAWRF